jgi:pilus assembly protein TadC
MRIYAMVLPQSAGRMLGRRFERTGAYLAEFIPEIKTDLVMADIGMSAEEYTIASAGSAVVLSVAVSVLTYVPLLAVADLGPGTPLAIAVAAALAVGALDFFALLRYPRILALKRAELIEKDLIYALKDLLLNISAGLSLFESIKKVSDGDHGLVSAEFRTVVESTNRGMPLDDALEELAIRSSSEYLRNALWQTINALKAGTSVKDALSGIMEALIREQTRKIRNYIQELNVLSMLYMLFAVAVPTIITTVLVVLTSLMGTGITEDVYLLVIGVCVSVQIALVGFIRSRRPMIYAS